MHLQPTLSPELVLEAYRQGLFPMAYSAGSLHIHWIRPDMRGQLSIPHMHIPRKLKKILLSGKNMDASYTVRINTAFTAVIAGCAETDENRSETWINGPIAEACIALHKLGHTHSVECWQDGRLVGGLYGLAIGGVFFGESMFSRKSNASKIALIHLVARLWKGGFTLLDTQFVNPHLLQFGAYEVPDAEYMKQLRRALQIKADFRHDDLEESTLIREYLTMRSGEK